MKQIVIHACSVKAYGRYRRPPRPFEVANCDLRKIRPQRLPTETWKSFRESSRVPSDRLVQSFRCDAVEFRKINVQHDAMAPDDENPLGDIVHPETRQQCVGLLFQILDHAVAKFN